MTSSKLQKISAWWPAFPLHQNHINLTFFPASLEQFLRAVWNNVSPAIVLILPQIKFDSKLSHCTFFKSKILWWPQRRDPEQTSLLCLSSTRDRILGTSRGPFYLSTSQESPDKFGLSWFWDLPYLIILSFIWQYIAGTWGSFLVAQW